MLAELQVNSVIPVLFVISAVGTVLFCVMVIELVDVQPLLPVTVTVYTPGAVTAKAAIALTAVLPSLQE
jgi:hypothetical protein